MNAKPATAGSALALLCALAAAPAHAQLADPTRPPGPSAPGSTEEPPAGRQLQSILFSGGRKLAVIDGQLVPIGGSLGDARVVRISETEVVLKTGEETETLKLYPGVEKQPVKRAHRSARAGKPSPVSPAPGGGK